jgi:nucleotide-binding universal stress UspA family protein
MIVVGVDGSAGSRAALAWALGEAELRGATVRAVHAWTVPTVPVATAGFTPAAVRSTGDATEYERMSREVLDATVDAVVSASDADAAVHRVLVQAPPAQALISAAVDAELLVVGSRGLGGFKELLLGSVSHQCANHAPCPVVIVGRDAA